MGAWTPETEPASVGGGAVTLVEGPSFCISTPGGDLSGAGNHGVFFRDTRILSRTTARSRRNHDLEDAGTFTGDRLVGHVPPDGFDAPVLPGGRSTRTGCAWMRPR